MKFRRLQKEELEELESDFVRFLSTNGITAEDWEKLKEEEKERAEKLIDIFSDMVFDHTLKSLEYLEYKTPKDIKTFHCGEEKMVMVGLMVEGDADIDFTEDKSPEEMLGQMQHSDAKLKLYRGEKQYSREREMELFEMMEKGALISRDGHLYKTLSSLYSQEKSKDA